MRRMDREVVSKERIRDVVENCNCCRLGFNDNGEIYIVPLNFGYKFDGEGYTFYFHGAKEGRKIDLIKKCPNVGFEMDTNYELEKSDFPCAYSAKYQSIIGNGMVKIVEEHSEKVEGLKLIMKQNTKNYDWQFDEKMIKKIMVFKLEVNNLSCKEHR
ncbi:pyridoxamine 5'-phosphate oxidase family protein [Peptostreptococcus faecalis]|uniref:pyridoxamine 5'-phosphate oxidase family protein n=1 Tax=Peptostreptococcus faecalis TaxID=2045015 RepID=UPI000C7E83DD|nr:pyridoxamine 5'-phosphate oxidase family protein [Peptostreptococcus faecalis]